MYTCNMRTYALRVIGPLTKAIRERPAHVIIWFTFLFLFIYVIFQQDSSVLNNQVVQQLSTGTQFVLVLQANLTDTQLNLFKFERSEVQANSVHTEVFSINTGLLSFIHQPKVGADSLRPLLDEALIYVPIKYHACTALTIRITTDLEPEVTELLYKEVNWLISTEYPFALVGNNAIEELHKSQIGTQNNPNITHINHKLFHKFSLSSDVMPLVSW